ncbi:MAG: TylF/MycF/NovP-related O-methyltransferase [Sphingomicrobium sp.]
MKLVNPELSGLLDLTDANTLMSARNRTSLYRQARTVLDNGIPGDFVEIGVHRGGSAAVLAHLLKDHPERTLHLFDRWGDLPQPTANDGHRQREYARENIPEKLAVLKGGAPLKAAKTIIEQTVGFDRAVYYQGWYEDTFPAYSGGKIAFASVDCDYYESVKLALSFLRLNASPGICIVNDDYDSWPGAKIATDEFIDDYGGDIRRTGLGPAEIRLDWRDSTAPAGFSSKTALTL